MRQSTMARSICFSLILGGAALAADVRQRIPLDSGWQAAKGEQGKILDSIPTDQVKWADYSIDGLPLPAGRGDAYQGWYRCRVKTPADWTSGTVWLRLENWLAARAACWVNGKRLPEEFWTGFLPVEWRVDEYLKPGEENEIVLCFWSLDWAKVQLGDKAITTDSEAGREFTYLVAGAKAAGDVRYLVPTGYGNGDPTLCFVGPTGPVVLEQRNRTFIDHVLTIPRIEGPALTVRTFPRRTDKTSKPLSTRCELYDGTRLVAKHETSPSSPDADGYLVSTFRCPGAELWWPDSPKLYRLEVTLCEGGTPIDKQTAVVGFREIAARGRQMLLNGVPYHGFGASSMPLDMIYTLSFLEPDKGSACFWTPRKEDARRLFRLLKSQNIRMFRLGQGVYPEVWLEAADEEGMLIVSESALCNSCCNSGIEIKEFWDHWRDNELGLIRRSGNHPSIIVWCMGNEVGHGGRGKIAYPRIAKVVAEIKKLDPSRLTTCSGDGDAGGCLDTVNIHYPQCGPGGSLYPGQDYPLSAYWLSNVDVWPGYYGVADQKLKGKPFFIGEWDSLFGAPPHVFACIYGDEVFVGGAPGSGPEQTFLQNQILHGRVVRQFIEGYRYNDVAFPAPWCLMPYMNGFYPQHNVSSVAKAYAPELLILKPMPDCFFGGGEAVCKAVMFNDTRTAKDYTAYFRLEVNNKVANGAWDLWWKTDLPGFVIEKLGRIEPGSKVEKELKFRIPPVDSPTPVRLYVIVNGDCGTVVRRTYRWTAYPRIERVEPEYQSQAVGVFDPKGALQKFVSQAGFRTVPLTAKLDKIAECRAVLLAENSLVAADPKGLEALRAFASKGGRVICLQQDRFPPLLEQDILPAGTPVRNTHNFVRADSHPVLAGVSNDQLRLWGKDLLVSRSPILKNDQPGMRYLADCGLAGFSGLSAATLVEVRYGRGSFLLCQMLLEANLQSSPGAERILLNLLRYAVKPPPEETRRLVLLSKDEPSWRSRFDAVGVTAAPAKDAGDAQAVLWCDDVAQLSDAVVKQVREGDTLVLYNLDPSSLAAVNQRFGLSIRFRQNPEMKKWWFANKTYRTGLLDGVSNQDLFYIAAELVVGAVFDKIEPVMNHPIDAGSQGGLIPACEPVGLCEISLGQGRVVFCQLNLFDTKNYLANGRRVLGQLASNLGLAPRGKQTGRMAGEKYAPIDLRRHANMGFQDEKAGDGQGGAFDQDGNDLRQFPTGSGQFAGVSFDVIDPKKNKDKSCVVLQSGHTPTAPQSVRSIAVGRRLDELAALLAVAWGPPGDQELGKIVLHYEGGGDAAELPIQYNRHVTEWWEPPQVLPCAKPAWVGSNPVHSPIVVYLARWANPKPEKVVADLDIVSSNTRCPVTIIGLTAVAKPRK